MNKNHSLFGCGIPILVMGFTSIACHKPAQSFDSTTWKRYTRRFDPNATARLDILDDLLSKTNLVGMTRENLLMLLGPPDFMDPSADPEVEAKKPDCKMFRYFLGPCGFGVAYLHIEFDDTFIVKNVRQFND